VNTSYIVKGTSADGCNGLDTLQIKIIHPFKMQASPGDSICTGETTRLKASGAAGYLWWPATGLDHPDIASPVAKPITSTRYRVVGFDGNNCFTDTGYVQVTVGQIPQIDINPTINMPTGSNVTLKPNVKNGPVTKWLWSPATDLSCADCATPVLRVRNNIAYSVKVTTAFNCVAQTNINVFAFCKSAQVFIPNAFTPDGDGLNDVLMIRGSGIRVNVFRIFNRWGEIVFEKMNFSPNDPNSGWDGKLRGVSVVPDVYVYTAEVVCDNNLQYTYKGNITLIK
jgi:gliding motility-associated-like protein